ncbi:hypothetical protein D3C73_1429830 [compost metagenome]
MAGSVALPSYNFNLEYGEVTVAEKSAVKPAYLAVIVTFPSPTSLIIPLSMVSTAEFDVDQVASLVTSLVDEAASSAVAIAATFKLASSSPNTYLPPCKYSSFNSL